jgi:alpha-tubulin suppressor-like RCC1 family protein
VGGASFSCAIVTGAQVRCWGYGAEGELGYPGVTTVGATNTPASVGPVDIGAGYTAVAISSGDYHTCVIRNDGRVLCWGYGADGRLGYGNASNVGDTESPAAAGPVDLGGHLAVAISAGSAFTCAILNDGSVRCWGFGAQGQLGYGNASNVGDGPPDESVASTGPVNLGGHTAVAISAGGLHTCAILEDGSVRCWGYGFDGQLGYGSTDDVGDGRGSDQSVASAGPVPLGGGALTIAAGGLHTCAILDGGSVRCWGDGADGQLGDGATGNVGNTPTTVPANLQPVPLGAGAVAISTGANDTCAILDGGSVRCWGYGGYGELGYGSQTALGDTQTSTPGMLGPVNLGAGRTALAISAGGDHTCARLDTGGVRCWGHGAYGELGYCSSSNVGDTPTDTPDTAGPVNLEPGDGGELCPPAAPPPAVPVNASPPSISGSAVAGSVLSEEHGLWSPAPTGYGYQWERCDSAGANCGSIAGGDAQTYTLAAADIGSTIRVLETASDDAGASAWASSQPTPIIRAAPVANPDVARERGWRRCLARVAAASKHVRALTHRGSKRQRARARRRLAREVATGHRRCMKIWGRTPGRVTGLRAVTRGKTKIELDFHAAGTDGNSPPAAVIYLVKQSPRPIRDQRDFTTARPLCTGACRFPVIGIGTNIVLTITRLHPRTTYYYAITARDNVTGRLGARSLTVKAKTA